MIDSMKRNVGQKAAEYVQKNMTVGLGTGSTVSFFIESLIEKRNQGLFFQCVASSQRSKEQAVSGGLEVLEIERIKKIDLYVDGADAINKKKQMIKGGGGALLREKILAENADRVLIIVDETKLVSCLSGKLPLAILSFGSAFTKKALEMLGYKGEWREKKEGEYFLSEDGHYILDVYKDAWEDPPKEHLKIISIPGVVETGLFFDIRPQIIIGRKKNNIEMMD